jgi:hypothetical protein
MDIGNSSKPTAEKKAKRAVNEAEVKQSKGGSNPNAEKKNLVSDDVAATPAAARLAARNAAKPVAPPASVLAAAATVRRAVLDRAAKKGSAPAKRKAAGAAVASTPFPPAPVTVPSPIMLDRAMKKTRSRTAMAAEPHQKQYFNYLRKAIRQCVQCKNVCESNHFYCLNCEAAYCQNCEKQWSTLGYEEIRPPCFCVIDSNGRATDLCKTDFKTWIPKNIIGHLFKTRKSTATFQSTILIVMLQCASAVRRRHTCTTLCCVGSLTQENKALLLKNEPFRKYVASCNPKPSVFLQLENRWKLPPAAHPVAVNTEILQKPWSVELFKMTRPDVD